MILIFASPLIFIFSFLIYFEDKGPVIYSQIRTGQFEKQFKIYKLRSMRINAEQFGAQWARKYDERITNIGVILRKFRIDELPQLWNVIKGDMSLIGPRPERPEFDKVLKEKIPNYELRFRMKPGLSGWAQVNYPYGASLQDSTNKLSYDLFYMKNFSILMDILILFKTIHLVINAKGEVLMNNNNTDRKIALITGITGQDGSYLAEFLLKKTMKFMALKDVQAV